MTSFTTGNVGDANADQTPNNKIYAPYEQPTIMCRHPPYKNPSALMSITGELFTKASPKKVCEERKVIRNPKGPVMPGHHADKALSGDQLHQLRNFLELSGLRRNLTIESLLVCKVIMGRWPVAREMEHLFSVDNNSASESIDLMQNSSNGTKQQRRRPPSLTSSPYFDPYRNNPAKHTQPFIYRRVAKLEPLKPDIDPPVGTGNKMREDRRISHIIGNNGSNLHGIAVRSKALFIWVMNNGTMAVYASGSTEDEALARTQDAYNEINLDWARYHPWPGSLSREYSVAGLKASPVSIPVLSPKGNVSKRVLEKVDFKHLHAVMSRQQVSV